MCKLIAWPKLIMISAGFWKLPITKNRFTRNIFFVYSIFMRSIFVLFMLLLMGELIRLIKDDYSITLIITSLSVLINGTKVAIKLLIYVKNNVLEMFKDVIKNEQEVWNSNEEIKNVYRAKVRICRIYVVALVTIMFIAVCALLSTGIVATAHLKQFNELNNETLESHFMYMTLFPRNKLENLGLIFALNALWSLIGVSFNSTTHLVFITLLVYSASRLEILQIKFRNYIEPDFSEESSEEQMREQIMVLKSLILEHKYIIGFVQHFNECTKSIVLMEFILSSLDMASVSINLIKMDASQMGWLFFYFILLGLQIFILGWTCNEIKIQSEAIAGALFESKWHLLNKEGRQLTQIMIARAQKPLTITIGPFGPMTNNSALLILKGAYSYVSIMRE